MVISRNTSQATNVLSSCCLPFCKSLDPLGHCSSSWLASSSDLTCLAIPGMSLQSLMTVPGTQ